jgi:hypothetical protein
MIRSWLSVFLILTLILPSLSCTSAGIGSGVSQALALAGAFQAIKPGLDETVNNAGGQANDAIRNAQTRMDYLIKQLNDSAKKLGKEAATQREDLSRQGFALMQALYEDTQRTRMNVAADVYRGMAAAATMLDSVPFVKVPDTPFAAVPLALKANTVNRRITVYGYFPSMGPDQKADVKFDSGQAVEGLRGIGSIEFDVPENIAAKEASFSDVSITLPRRGWFSPPQTFHTRIFVLPKKSFHLDVTFLARNDQAYRDVTGTPQRIDANSNLQDNHWVRNVADLFATSVSNHADFDNADTLFKDVVITDLGGGKPCSTCPDTSFDIHLKTPQQIDLSVRAPNCPYHVVSLFNVCGGGGSNRSIQAVPVFTTRLAGTPRTTPIKIQELEMADHDQIVVDEPQGTREIQITVSVSDGVSTAKDFGELGENASAFTAAPGTRAFKTWNASVVAGNRIQITTGALPVDFRTTE